MRARHLVLISFPFLAMSAWASAQEVYRLTDLGALDDTESVGASINASGQVTGGTFNSNGGGHAFFWDGTLSEDLTPGSVISAGAAINDAGQVTGYRYTPFTAGFVPHAFLWDGRGMRDLHNLSDLLGTSFGIAINASGQVTGHSSVPHTPFAHAFLYDGIATLDLGTLGGDTSHAFAINDVGQVAGESRVANNTDTHAFLWDGTASPKMLDLGTLGGPHSVANDLNAAGQVTGYAHVAGNAAFHAFLWDRSANPKMQDLGTLGGDSSGIAINEAGQVTGWSRTSGPIGATEAHAFLWEGGMRDLGTLGGTITQPTAINASGHVVGFSHTSKDEEFRAFLWDGTAMRDLNKLIDPADPLQPYVTLFAAGSDNSINDLGQIVANGCDSRTTECHAYFVSPATPDDLSANVGRTGKGQSKEAFVDLTWSDNFLDESGYSIERSAVTGKGQRRLCGAFAEIGTAGEGSTGFRDSTVTRHTDYCYQLRVFRATVVPTLSNVARIKAR